MMPAHKVPTLSPDEAPAILTAEEWAALNRCDVRVAREDFESGRVPGAYRVGSRWRVARDTWLASIGLGGDDDACGD
jgi:hypothetical protein